MNSAFNLGKVIFLENLKYDSVVSGLSIECSDFEKDAFPKGVEEDEEDDELEEKWEIIFGSCEDIIILTFFSWSRSRVA